MSFFKVDGPLPWDGGQCLRILLSITAEFCREI